MLICFCKDKLFAFAKKSIEEYLTAKWEDEEVKKLVAELKGDGEDLADVSKAVERFNVLTDENSVNSGLKTLQGILYKKGYENGELKAHVFEDIKSSLEEWSKHRKICIYSTGAEEAQKQYFTHSTAGDLNPFISKYFDQKVGVKTSSESYESIAKDLEIKTQEMVFLSDDIDEINAAQKAGCVAVLVTREGNAEVKEEQKKDHMVISSFTDIPLSAKRKNQEDTSSEGPPTKVAKVDSTEEKVEKPREDIIATITQEKMEVDSSKATDETTPAPVSEECKTEMAVDEVKSSDVTETSTETEKVESTEKTIDTTETVTTTETTTETKAEEKEKVIETDSATKTTEETKSTEVAKEDKMDTTEKTEATTESKTETTVEKTAETTVEPEKEKVESTTEEAKQQTEEKTEVVSESPKVEETKGEPKEAAEKKENGDAKAAENGTEEKENKSELANGTADNTTTTEPGKNGVECEEVKVKKIEETTENVAPVTVEA